MDFDVSVVVPVFNEASGIPRLVTELGDYFSGQNFRTEVIFVDDGSRDGSGEILKKQDHRFYEPRLVRLAKNCGSHRAIRAGIHESSGKYTVCLPADLQDPPSLIGRLREKCLEGYAIVFAARNSSTANPGGFFSRLYASLVRRFLFSGFPENGFDVVMFDAAVREELNRRILPASSLFLQILGLNHAKSFIRYDKTRRTEGKSGWTLSKRLKLFIDSFFPSRRFVPAEKAFPIAENIRIGAARAL